MANEVNLTKAKQVYQDFCAMMDNAGWNYQKEEEKLTIKAGARGDDLPMDLIIKVDAERQVVRVISFLPYTIAEDKRLDVAVAVSVVNNSLVSGYLDFDIAEGNLVFRMTNSYRDSLLGREVYKFLLYAACHAIDDFNDQFLMLSKGIISLEKFIEQYSKK